MEIAKRGPGRPFGPEELAKREKANALVNELRAKVELYEKALTTKEDPLEEIKVLADMVRTVQRAIKGLSDQEDVFYNLINAKDIRERTRLDETNLISHSAMRIASKQWPKLKLFETIADVEDPYYISLDGEGRKEGILLLQAKSKLDANLILNMPNTAGGVAQTEQPTAQIQQKKGFFNRVFKR